MFASVWSGCVLQVDVDLLQLVFGECGMVGIISRAVRDGLMGILFTDFDKVTGFDQLKQAVVGLRRSSSVGVIAAHRNTF